MEKIFCDSLLNCGLGAAFDGLARRAAHIMAYSLADNTKVAYSTGQKSYLCFALDNKFAPFPLNDDYIILWATKISMGRKSATIDSYITSVRSLSRLFGFEPGKIAPSKFVPFCEA